MRRQLLPAIVMLALFTALCGVAYPLAVTGVAQVAFPAQAEGSLVEVDGVPVGSSLVGQSFAGAGYFHPRPSSAGDGYDGAASSGSNVGPTNEDWLHGTSDDPTTPDEDESADGVEQLVAAYREENRLGHDVAVPVDAVTGSASGLDPHISVANARLQAPRVAEARGLPVEEVLALVGANVDARPLGILGDAGVNVLGLNLALDRAVPMVNAP